MSALIHLINVLKKLLQLNAPVSRAVAICVVGAAVVEATVVLVVFPVDP